MMRTTIYPTKKFYHRPMFWGVERDLKEVLDAIEHTWTGTADSSDLSAYVETEHAYFLQVEVPGLNKTNLDIQLDGETVTIKGKRKLAIPGTKETEHLIEKSYALPENVETEKIQAHCEDGILTLALPKLNKAKPKKIEISDNQVLKSSWKNLIGETFFGKKDEEPTVVN